VSGPLVVVSTLEELAGADLAGRIVLLRGAIAREPLMPKNCPFYASEEHQRTLELLEAGQPPAIVTATARNPAMSGALYPAPLIEDGDVDIPSV
jgi:aminopeptidase YwaD